MTWTDSISDSSMSSAEWTAPITQTALLIWNSHNTTTTLPIEAAVPQPIRACRSSGKAMLRHGAHLRSHEGTIMLQSHVRAQAAKCAEKDLQSRMHRVCSQEKELLSRQCSTALTPNSRSELKLQGRTIQREETIHWRKRRVHP